jgi:hypothetical protein
VKRRASFVGVVLVHVLAGAARNLNAQQCPSLILGASINYHLME